MPVWRFSEHFSNGRVAQVSFARPNTPVFPLNAPRHSSSERLHLHLESSPSRLCLTASFIITPSSKKLIRWISVVVTLALATARPKIVDTSTVDGTVSRILHFRFSHKLRKLRLRTFGPTLAIFSQLHVGRIGSQNFQIGRASWRERVF